MILRWLTSPANWCGLGLASLVLVLKALGLLGTLGLGVAALGYAAGFVGGGLWLGFPSKREPEWEALQFSDEGDAREAMERALNGVRRLTEHNPDNRIPASLQARVLELCKALDGLLQQWERSRGSLSLQDSFHARHIAIRYLPEALNTYLSIPAAYATGHVLENGKTAQETFKDTVAELEAKVRQLGDDLASQDAHAFLVHSKFLKQKFGEAAALPGLAPEAESPALNLPQSAALPAGAPPAKEP
ncbi:MAG: hypothetical protein IPP87_16895 [Ideonella sp.]|nr:hypothetical protein [Ideonella sp.]